MMHSETFDGSRSEQPDKELGREQRQTAAKDDAGKLPLRTHLSEHESQPADHDRNQGERPRERTRERSFEVPGGALPRRLREHESRKENEHSRYDYEPYMSGEPDMSGADYRFAITLHRPPSSLTIAVRPAKIRSVSASGHASLDAASLNSY
jgi:hypothetical protein